MADNKDLAALTGNVAADEVAYSGDTAVVQLARIVAVAGSEGSKTVVENMPASLGQKAMAASFPVVLPSDQTVNVTGSLGVTGLGGSLEVMGDTAHGATDEGGYPLKVGGVYVASPTGVTDGDAAAALTDQFGQQRVVIGDASDASETVNVNGGNIGVNLATNSLGLPLPVSLADTGGDAITTLPVSGPLTDTQLRATAVPVSGTVAVTGIATAANQATEIGHLDGLEGLLTTIDADTSRIPSLGQAVMASSVPVTLASNQSAMPVTQSGTWDEVGINDSGNSITVDGTFWQATQPVSIATAPALVASSANIGDVDVLTIAAGDNNIGNVDIVTMPNVTIGTMAALVAGSAAIGKLAANSGVDIGDVDITTVIPGTGATQLGKAVDSAGGSTDTGVAALGLREDALVTVTPADGDYARMKLDSLGKQWVNTGLSPELYISKSFNATTTQTGIDVWDPAGGKKIAVSSVVIGTYGTTAARVILWFGDNADTTYSAGTDQLLLAASFVPSATASPGLVFTPAQPVICNTADRELHVTTSAGISLDIAVHGFEF